MSSNVLPPSRFGIHATTVNRIALKSKPLCARSFVGVATIQIVRV